MRADQIQARAVLVLFLVYQQLQDRIIQPLLYKGGALKVNPAVAIVAVIDELVFSGAAGSAAPQPEAAD
jgi:predicted PurR-regulated permease PerM